jgi:BTB/POZ domain
LIKNSISSDDEKKSDSMVTVYHKGKRQNGLLRKDLRLTWPVLNKTPTSGTVWRKTAGLVFQEEYPDLICNFQIIIKIPDDYEAKGLKFINNKLSKLLETESLADIKFVFKDDHIAAHSAIIAASSPVFAAMFEGGRFKEGQTRTVNIEDIDSRVFRKLLQFLYTGSSGCSKQDPSDMLKALFFAADKYQVGALKDICEEFLICQFEIENVLCHLEWAHLYGAEKLKDAAVTYIVQRRNEVWQLKECEDFNKKYPDLFFLVCKRMVN